MATAAKRPCSYPGCSALVHGAARCEKHQHRGTAAGFGDRSRGSRQSRGYGAEWDRLRRIVMNRDAGQCQPCKHAGKVTQAYAVDHIKAKAYGGRDELTNLEAICKPCHAAKTAAEGAAASQAAARR